MLKINFTDFWSGFEKTDNYLFNLISKHHQVEIADDPDILFFSCYGNSYLEYDCLRVFYTAENLRPDFTGCDFALTFDYNSHPNHYRLPLYAFYLEQKSYWQKILENISLEEAERIWHAKKKFCCMVVSNGRSPKRIEFYKKLSRYYRVDSGGRFMNNVGGPVQDKLEFIKDYRFVISFENSSHPGYTTEKILEPLMVKSIPIYWGDPRVSEEFNPQAFLNRHDFQNDDELIEKIHFIDTNPRFAIEMLAQPVFPNNRYPHSIEEANIMHFLNRVIDAVGSMNPVAKKSLRWLHAVRSKQHTLKYYCKKVLGNNFR